VDAFATADDLGKTLRRVFTNEEKLWIDELLAQASAHLRSVIGQNIYPVTQSTYTGYPQGGREDIPQWPVVSVDAVERDGKPVEYRYRPGYITVDSDEPVEVTFTWGYETSPPELARIAQVLVSQTLLPLEAKLGLTAGGLSSVAIDDFKLAWADAGASSGMVLTPHAQTALRLEFGRGDATVVDAV
jgi:hypothetical protein